MRFNLPKSNAGRRVGLLGGSFDPAHEGHVRISEQALKRFDLDQVWWLVSPANPLKPQGPAPLDKRVAHAKRLIDHPRIVITDVETSWTQGSPVTACVRCGRSIPPRGSPGLWGQIIWRRSISGVIGRIYSSLCPLAFWLDRGRGWRRNAHLRRGASPPPGLPRAIQGF